jgi:anti-sigma B factor antagonist
MGLQLFVRRAADVVIIDLHGKATIGAANDILRSQLRRLIEDGTSKVLVNLTDVTRLDSSSIGTIVSAFMTLKRRGANLKLRSRTTPQGPRASREGSRRISERCRSNFAASLTVERQDWECLV